MIFQSFTKATVLISMLKINICDYFVTIFFRHKLLKPINITACVKLILNPRPEPQSRPKKYVLRNVHLMRMKNSFPFSSNNV